MSQLEYIIKSTVKKLPRRGQAAFSQSIFLRSCTLCTFVTLPQCPFHHGPASPAHRIIEKICSASLLSTFNSQQLAVLPYYELKQNVNSRVLHKSLGWMIIKGKTRVASSYYSNKYTKSDE